jgi:hypothetical protein
MILALLAVASAVLALSVLAYASIAPFDDAEARSAWNDRSYHPESNSDFRSGERAAQILRCRDD